MTNEIQYTRGRVVNPSSFTEQSTFRAFRASDGMTIDILGINREDIITFLYRRDELLLHLDGYVADVDTRKKFCFFDFLPVNPKASPLSAGQIASVRADIVECLSDWEEFKRGAKLQERAALIFEFLPPASARWSRLP